MPADRHQRKKARTSAGGNAEAGPSSGPGFKVLPLEQRGSDALPGVNKLKGALRQAKRLLTKVRCVGWMDWVAWKEVAIELSDG